MLFKEGSIRFSACVLLFALILSACSQVSDKPAANMAAAREGKKNVRELRDAIKKLEPFFQPMGKPATSDWLASHNEPGQTFDEYLDSDPTKPTGERGKIYVQPLGSFTPQQKKIVEIVEGYLGVFYGLTVSELPAKSFKRPLSVKDYRHSPQGRGEQIRTGYILEGILKPILPADGAALIALTAEDLYPDASMYYVFGQASLEDRVGVWSLARLDDNADYDTFLRRTLKIAAHETGHMFSMRHCTKYECVMSGTNHLGETDRRPIDACPECTAKICWMTGANPAERYTRLEAFCRSKGMMKEADDFRRKAEAVK